MKWEYVIGLEVHAQIKSKSKLFSRASTAFGAEPNHQVSFIDAAMPGMLPVPNFVCIEQAIKTGIAVNANINETSFFDRKNYFYPDLPQGYQISQFYTPLVENGFLKIKVDGVEKVIRINRIHVEQDAGKSFHDQSDKYTLVDLNRAGIGLMEIVSEPDIRSAQEAAEYVKTLRTLLRYLGTCDGDMEKGSMRCDVNVSVRKFGDTKLGTRCEIKNVNSIKNIVKAIEYEAQRQIDILESGGEISQNTMLFDADTETTRVMRSKEEANDYRYFPDPDLPPLVLERDIIDKIKEYMPELPDQKITRYKNILGLSDYDSEVLSSDIDIASYFDQVDADPKISANWITSELFAYLNQTNTDIKDSIVTPKHLSLLVNLVTDGIISGKIAKVVFENMCITGAYPQEIIEEKGLVQISDQSTIEKLVDKILEENKDKVIEYRNGKVKLFGFFVGQVMKESEGKANPKILNDILAKKL